MRVEVHKEFKLILTQQEAEWLKGQMQNPLHKQHPDDESETDYTMRKMFWDNLQ